MPLQANFKKISSKSTLKRLKRLIEAQSVSIALRFSLLLLMCDWGVCTPRLRGVHTLQQWEVGVSITPDFRARAIFFQTLMLSIFFDKIFAPTCGAFVRGNSTLGQLYYYYFPTSGTWDKFFERRIFVIFLRLHFVPKAVGQTSGTN